MKVIVLYRPVSEFARAADTFIHDFRRQHEAAADKIQPVDIDTRDGRAIVSLYDIVQYPAVLVLADDGTVLKDWQGPDLPLLNEVAGYLGF